MKLETIYNSMIKQAAANDLPNLAGQGTSGWDNDPNWLKWQAPGTYSPGAGYFRDQSRRGGAEVPQQDPTTRMNIPGIGETGPSGGAKAYSVPQGVSGQVWKDLRAVPGITAREFAREAADVRRSAGAAYNAAKDYVSSGNMASDIGTALGTAVALPGKVRNRVNAYIDDADRNVGQVTGKQIGSGVNAYQRAAGTAPKITLPANGPYIMADRSPADNLNVSAVENQRWDVPASQQYGRIRRNTSPTPAANGPYAPMDRSPEDMKNALSAQKASEPSLYQRAINSPLGRSVVDNPMFNPYSIPRNIEKVLDNNVMTNPYSLVNKIKGIPAVPNAAHQINLNQGMPWNIGAGTVRRLWNIPDQKQNK